MVIWTGAVGKIVNTAGTATAAGKVGTSTLAIDKVTADTTVACSIGAAHVQLTLDTYGRLHTIILLSTLILLLCCLYCLPQKTANVPKFSNNPPGVSKNWLIQQV